MRMKWDSNLDGSVSSPSDESSVGGVQRHAEQLLFSMSIHDLEPPSACLHLPQRHRGVHVSCHHLSEGGVVQGTGQTSSAWTLWPWSSILICQPLTSSSSSGSGQFEQSQIIFAGHQQMRLRLCRTTRSHEQEGEVSMFWDSTQLQTRELEVDSFEAVMWRDVPDPQLLIQSRKKSSSDFYRRYRSSSFLTHSISGVAKDLLHGLVDGNIQYSGAVTQQCGYRTSGDKPAPEPDRSVRTSCDHQLQRCTVVKAFNTLKRERERETTEYMLFPFSFSSLSLVIVQHFKPGKTKPW